MWFDPWVTWHEVSSTDQVKTAQYLEKLLRSHHIPFRSLLKTTTDGDEQ